MSIRAEIKENLEEYEGYYALKNRDKELRRAIRAIKRLSAGFEHDEFVTGLEIVLNNNWELIREEVSEN